MSGKDIEKSNRGSGVERYGYGRIEADNPWLKTGVISGTVTGIALVLMVLTGIFSIAILQPLFTTLFVLGFITTAGSGAMVSKQIFIDKKKH